MWHPCQRAPWRSRSLRSAPHIHDCRIERGRRVGSFGDAAADGTGDPGPALPHRAGVGRRLSDRHAPGRDLGHRRPRPACRPPGRRTDPRVGEPAPACRLRPVRLAHHLSLCCRPCRVRRPCHPRRRCRSERAPPGAARCRPRVTGVAQPRAAPRQPRLPWPYVGTLRDVDLAGGIPRGELPTVWCGRCPWPCGAGHLRRDRRRRARCLVRRRLRRPLGTHDRDDRRDGGERRLRGYDGLAARCPARAGHRRGDCLGHHHHRRFRAILCEYRRAQ